MATDFGNVPANVTLPILFTTYGKTNGESITMSGLAVTDIEVYKSTSVTQRASDNGYALVDTDGIDIDGVTGLHGISIDLSDNSDAGFYAAGSFYTVVVSTITVDSQTVTFIAATFRIVAAENTSGTPVVDLDLGRAFTAQAGGATSVTLDASASSTSNYYNGWLIYPISGTGARQAPQVITAYNGSTKVATIARHWATTTDSTTVFRMWPSAVSVEAWKLGTVPTPNFTGYPLTEVGRWANGAVPTPNQTGVPRVEVTHINNVSASSVTTVSSHIGTSGANTPQTGDAYARLGAPAGASVSADIATKSTQTSVDDIPTNAELATALGTSDDAVLAAIAALNNLSSSQAFTSVLTTQLTESYAADGTAPTLAQAIFLIQQSLHEFAISGTTRTVKKLDGSSTAATFTLDSATAPTSTTRAS